jgi:16S rRNA (adenine1518-N6/adenine1519-N6)-dimethyltransferase
LEAIVLAADVHPGEQVLEIGPGLGVLTRALVAEGARVLAIEQDRRFLEYLTTHGEGDVSITHGDAATLDWMPLVQGKPWKLVSNLPYSITSLAIRKALWASEPPENVVVLIQREVAERAIAKNGKQSLLSLMVGLASTGAKIVRRVPPGAFYPPPKVDSAVLALTPLSWPERQAKWGLNPERIMECAKRGFAHPRKRLASNLELKGEAAKVLEEVGLDPDVRAEDVSLEQWAALARALNK